MIRSRRQADIGTICDLHTPLTDHDRQVLQDLYRPAPVIRQVRPKACNCGDIDCLACWDAGIRYADYLQQKHSQEF